jgi:hypothetical protein
LDAVTPPSNAVSFSEDFIPMLVLSAGLKTQNSFNVSDLEDFSTVAGPFLGEKVPNAVLSDTIPVNLLPSQLSSFNNGSTVKDSVGASLYPRAIEDFWMSNPISRRSKTLAKASQAFDKKFPFKSLFIFI